MSRNLREVEGKLLSDAGEPIEVVLGLTTVELAGQFGVEDEAVSEVQLMSNNVPDGEYTLEYFFIKLHCVRVRVKFGALVAR